MVTISKSKFKTNMLAIFRQIEETGEEVVVTDNNRPVLRIQPIAPKSTVQEIFAAYRGKMILHEDPDTPTTAEWGEV